MAKIQEQNIIFTVSKLVKNDDNSNEGLVSQDTIDSLQSVAEELLGDGVVVEVVVQ